MPPKAASAADAAAVLKQRRRVSDAPCRMMTANRASAVESRRTVPASSDRDSTVVRRTGEGGGASELQIRRNKDFPLQLAHDLRSTRPCLSPQAGRGRLASAPLAERSKSGKGLSRRHGLASKPPHPDSFASLEIRPLPASGERCTHGTAVRPFHRET